MVVLLTLAFIERDKRNEAKSRAQALPGMSMEESHVAARKTISPWFETAP